MATRIRRMLLVLGMGLLVLVCYFFIDSAMPQEQGGLVMAEEGTKDDSEVRSTPRNYSPIVVQQQPSYSGSSYSSEGSNSYSSGGSSGGSSSGGGSSGSSSSEGKSSSGGSSGGSSSSETVWIDPESGDVWVDDSLG